MLNRIGCGGASKSSTEHSAKTLNALIAGGLHDHLGGGFHRAVQDNAWNLPFFEKRCGDSAQLIPVLLDASDAWASPYGEIALSTGQWLINSLQGDDGYLPRSTRPVQQRQRPAQRRRYLALGARSGAAAIVGEANAKLFCGVFKRTEPAAGFHVPNAKGELASGAAETLPTVCARLAAARHERPQPWANTSVLLEERGMVLCALNRLAQW